MTKEFPQQPELSESDSAYKEAIGLITTSAELLLDSEKTIYTFERATLTTVNGNTVSLSQHKYLKQNSQDVAILKDSGPVAIATDEWFRKPEDDIFPFGIWSGTPTGTVQKSVFSGSNGVQHVYDLRTGETFPCLPGDTAAESRRDELVDWFLSQLDNDSALGFMRVRQRDEVTHDATPEQQAGDPYEFVHFATLRSNPAISNNYPDSYYQFKLKTDDASAEHRWLVVGSAEAFITTSFYNEATDRDAITRQPATLQELQQVGSRLAEYATH